MFKRYIQIKVVKPKKVSTDPNTVNDDPFDIFDLSDMFADALGEISKYIVGYLVLDTVRQIAIRRAEYKYQSRYPYSKGDHGC